MSIDGIVLLDNPIQRYAWGSRTVLAGLLGRAVPSPEPEAELWIGAHPTAPSRVGKGGPRLDDEIRRDPVAVLGPRLADEFGAELPFLLKILAVERPLSLQAHPNLEQARAGFAREEAAGLARNSPERTYPDANQKAEMVCALAPFEALVGFREADEIWEQLAAFDSPILSRALEHAGAAGARERLRALVRSLLTLARSDVQQMLADVRERIARGASNGAAARWTLRLIANHPADPAALFPFVLHAVALAPGEAMFLRPGVPHSYLSGVAVELMTSSDNVVRAGLTTKHVDVDGLLDVLDCQPQPPAPIEVAGGPSGWVPYAVRGAPFALHYARLAPGRPVDSASGAEPALLLVTEGQATVRNRDTSSVVELNCGQAALVPACVDRYELEGEGSVYRATVGSDAR